jgi:hypothetical protein
MDCDDKNNTSITNKNNNYDMGLVLQMLQATYQLPPGCHGGQVMATL